MPDFQSTRVIVIGAGVVGASIAFHLARSGAGVTLFDKGDVCAGMSARSGALVRMHYTFAPEAELAWKSLNYFANWKEMVGDSGNGSGCGFRRTGFAVVAGPDNAGRLRANVAMMKELGIDCELVDGAALRRIDPAVNVEDVALAAYEPQSGYANPIATTHSLVSASANLGATLMMRTPIVSIDIGGGGAIGASDPFGHLHRADAVCLVAGPWTDRLLAPLGLKIGLRSERAQIAFFRRSPEIRHLAYIDIIAGSYFRPHGDNLTLAGLGEWRQTGDQPDPDNFRQLNDSDFVVEVSRRLGSRIGRLRGAPLVHGHSGIYDVSPDARAVMGKVPGIDNLYVAAGFSGTGFKTAPAVGAAMAELILAGRSTTVDLTPFCFERITSGNLIRTANEYSMGGDFGHTL